MTDSALHVKRAKVLYVEDHAHLRESVSAILRMLGYEVETAVDGQDGLTRALENGEAYDLILTDIRMPRVDGITMVKQIRKSRSTPPIIIYSDLYSHGEDLGALGIAAIIAKGEVDCLTTEIGKVLSAANRNRHQ